MTGAGSFSSEGIMHKQSWEQYLKEYAEDKGFELEITNGFKALIIDKEQDYELWEAKMREIYDWTVGKGYKESFEYFIEHDSA